MFSKIIFVLATVSVIKASVLTVKVYDDDPEIEVASNAKDCNFQACDQLCRRLKFHGSACVNGHCKCDNFLDVEDVSEENPTDLEDFTSLKDVKASPSSCNFKGCDSLCRGLNKGSGTCIKGRCKCENSLITEEKVPEESLSSSEDSIVRDGNDSEAETKQSSCNNQACDQLCRRLKFTGGVCVNGQCKCDNFLNAEVTVFDDPLSYPEDLVSPKACRTDKCNELCIKLKLRGGSCIDGCCACNKLFSQKNDVTDPAKFDVEDTVASRACNNKKCNQLCRKQKFRGGACLGANCYCNKFLSLQDDIMTDSADTLSLRSCNSIACDDQCRRSGWHSGVCINGQCKCDYFLYSEGAENSLTNFEDTISPKRCTHEACNAFCRKHQFREGVCNGARCRCYKYDPTLKDEVSEESLPVSELSEDRTERRCNPRVCHQLCQGLKLSGGVCVNGRCKCEHRTQVDAVEEYLDFATRRICRLTKCNCTCTHRGYKRATCVKGRCKCYKITKTSLPVSELSEDPTERGCNVQTNYVCDQLCLRLKFPVGACVNRHCKCDNFLGIDVDAVDKHLELATRRVCNLRKCNRTCTRRGYACARCVNERCNCYDKIQREGASQLNDVNSVENKESNEILSNEEELSYRGAAPSVCNVVSCSTCTVFCLAVTGGQ